MKTSGVYKMVCTRNGKFYVGSSDNFLRRFKKHISQLQSHTHPNKHLQNAWDKHGENAFRFYIIEECEKDKIEEIEQFWLDTLRPYDPEMGYNLSMFAVSPMKNRHHSEEAKRRIGLASKGNKYNLGRHLSEDHKRNISLANIGHPKTSGMTGKKHSEETRKKIAKANTGKKQSKETLAKLSAVRKGMKQSEATQEKKRKAMKEIWKTRTREVSSSARKKMSAARKAWWAKRKGA